MVVSHESIDGVRWSLLHALGSSPPAVREGACAVVDGHDGVLAAFFGGVDSNGVCQNTLSVFSSAHSSVSQSWISYKVGGETPTARSGHSLSACNAGAILFGGGKSEGSNLNDVCLLHWRKRVWQELKTTGPAPSPRRGHAAAVMLLPPSSLGLVDTVEAEPKDSVPPLCEFLIVIGGGDGQTALQDIFALNLFTLVWTQLKLPSSPSPRGYMSSSVFSSNYFPQGVDLHQIASSLNDEEGSAAKDKSAKKNKSTPNDVREVLFGVPGRSRSVSALEVNRRIIEPAPATSLMCFGGSDGKRVFSDVWVLQYEKARNALNFRNIGDIGMPRLGAPMIALGSTYLILGGHDGKAVLSSIIAIHTHAQPISARQISCRGSHLQPRAHTCAFSSSAGQAFLFGGTDGKNYFDNLFSLELGFANFMKFKS